MNSPYAAFFFACLILLLSSCDENSSPPGNAKKVKQVIIHSNDIINGVEHKVTNVYDYLYANDEIAEIMSEGKKIVTFQHANGKVVEKRYFNNLEQAHTIDSFFYSPSGQLISIKSYNNPGYQVQDIALTYDGDKISGLTSLTHYQMTYVDEYHYTWSGINIPDASVTFTGGMYTYQYDFTNEANRQDPDFYIRVLGLYTTFPFGIHGTTVPIMFSGNSVSKVTGYDMGNFSWENTYEYVYDGDSYSKLFIKSYDQHHELLNAYDIEFYY